MSTCPSDVHACTNARFGSVGPGIDENQRSQTAYSLASVVNAGSFCGSKHFMMRCDAATLPPGCAP